MKTTAIQPQPGDVIYVWRKKVYKHFGVFIGDDGDLKNQVIHFSGKEKDIAFRDVDVIQTSLKTFLKGGKLKIQNPNHKSWDPLPAEEIIKNAKEFCGKAKGTYNIIFNNCEHFANWCRFGKHVSVQVRDAVTAVSVTVVAGVVAKKVYDAISDKKV